MREMDCYAVVVVTRVSLFPGKATRAVFKYLQNAGVAVQRTIILRLLLARRCEIWGFCNRIG